MVIAPVAPQQVMVMAVGRQVVMVAVAALQRQGLRIVVAMTATVAVVLRPHVWSTLAMVVMVVMPTETMAAATAMAVLRASTRWSATFVARASVE
jgi:hypothetical protein